MKDKLAKDYHWCIRTNWKGKRNTYPANKLNYALLNSHPQTRGIFRYLHLIQNILLISHKISAANIPLSVDSYHLINTAILKGKNDDPFNGTSEQW